MAQVARDPKLRERIDDYLDYLLRTWEAVPETAAEWDQWDDLSRLTFTVDWGVPEDRLYQLQQWAEQNLLTPEQCARYKELLALVAEHRPTLEQMLAD